MNTEKPPTPAVASPLNAASSKEGAGAAALASAAAAPVEEPSKAKAMLGKRPPSPLAAHGKTR